MSEDMLTRALRARGSTFLNTRQAAHFLGVSLRHLERLRGRGEGPQFCYHSRNVRYDPEDLLDWSRSRRRAQRHA